MGLFVDSGAFTANSRGVKINVHEYAQWLLKHKDKIEYYANLDDIMDPEITYENQKILEGYGLSPVPCFHVGEDFAWLKRYLEEGYEFIALGGLVPVKSKWKRKWLDHVWGSFLTDSDGWPKVRVHGFGIASIFLLLRYPWFSVDSTAWFQIGRYGSVWIPLRDTHGKYRYDQEPYSIAISKKSPQVHNELMHYDNVSPLFRKEINAYFSYMGVNKDDLRDHWSFRYKLNARYFFEVEKLPPRPFRVEIARKGFFR